MLRRFALSFLAAIAALVLPVLPVAAADARIFAAASLVDALDALGEGFEKATGRTVEIVPGSSSTMAQQVLAGAPADLFLSANKRYADAVAKAVGGEVHELFGNALAIIAPADFAGTVTLSELPERLDGGRLAIGDPAHVPAGIYANEALENAGLWDELEDRLAPASDVRGAVAFVARGAVKLGIVYRTDAAVEGVRIAGEIDESLHTPVRYWGVATNPDNVTAEMFMTYIISLKGQNILDHFGFTAVFSPDD